jgi:F0F1-type ATP synthase membrane subunit b/b'
MPQFDFFTYSSQAFWTLFTFYIFYFFILKFYLVPYIEILKMRRKLIKYYF